MRILMQYSCILILRTNNVYIQKHVGWLTWWESNGTQVYRNGAQVYLYFICKSEFSIFYI